jgi:hypothetical protein
VSADAEFYEESFPRMEKTLTGKIVLTNKRILCIGDRESKSLELEDISSVTTESNFKLQVYNSNAGMLYQMIFDRESVLKWQDLVAAMIEKEFQRIPNLR